MISIIVPVYNAGPHLEDCLNSVLGQTYKNIELVLVDDASSDGSLSICRRYAGADRRILLLENEKNLGQVASYLKGISASSGEYIGFVDSDDWVEPDMFDKLLTALESSNADASICGLWQELPSGGRRAERPSSNSLVDRDALVTALCDVHFAGNDLIRSIGLYRCNKLLKKKLVADNIRYANPHVRVFEDNNFVIPMLADCDHIALITEPLYHYRRHPGSTMDRFDDSVIDARIDSFKTQQRIFVDKGIKHRMQSDVLSVDSYILIRAFKSDENDALAKVLNLLDEDFATWGVGFRDVMRLETSLKTRILLLAVKAHAGKVILILARLLRLIQRL